MFMVPTHLQLIHKITLKIQMICTRQELFKNTTFLASTETNKPMNLLSKGVSENHKTAVTFHECFMHTILTIPLPNFYVCSFQGVSFNILSGNFSLLHHICVKYLWCTRLKTALRIFKQLWFSPYDLQNYEECSIYNASFF